MLLPSQLEADQFGHDGEAIRDQGLQSGDRLGASWPFRAHGQRLASLGTESIPRHRLNQHSDLHRPNAPRLDEDTMMRSYSLEVATRKPSGTRACSRFN